MDLTTISAELKEKTKEFRSLEKTYEAALSRVNKEHAKAKIDAPAQINSQIESIKHEIARDQDRLSELKSAGLSKNKDGSISQRSNAGKEAVRLQDKIPQLKGRLSNKHKEAASILTKLNRETEEKHESLKSEFETNSTELPGAIKSLLTKYHQIYIADKTKVAEKIFQGLHTSQSIVKIKNYVEKFRTQEPLILQTSSADEIVKKYFDGSELKSFTITHPSHHQLMVTIFSSAFLSIRRRRHFLRWGLFYIFWGIALWVAFKYDDQSKAEIEGALAIGCIILWPITFVWSFLYKKSKYKIYKMANNEFGEIKTALDQDIRDAILDFWNRSIKKDVGVDLSDLIAEFRMEKK